MKRGLGFTFIEILVVLVIASLTLTLVAFTLSRYQERSAARRAGEIFGQDLRVARSLASRSRQSVVVDFDESRLGYVIRLESGDTMVHRAFGASSDLRLSSLDLQLAGDTLVFSSRGVADLSGAGGSLGRAMFRAGTTWYAVSFNSMGSSKVERP